MDDGVKDDDKVSRQEAGEVGLMRSRARLVGRRLRANEVKDKGRQGQRQDQ